MPDAGPFPTPHLWARLRPLLPDFLRAQSWSGRRCTSVHVETCIPLGGTWLALLTAHMEGGSETCALPLHVSNTPPPEGGIAWLAGEGSGRALCDAGRHRAFWRGLFQAWKAPEGPVAGTLDDRASAADSATVQILSGEQSNALAFIDDRFCVKLYRRPGSGREAHLLRALEGSLYVPRLRGAFTVSCGGRPCLVATCTDRLDAGTDGWTLALAQARQGGLESLSRELGAALAQLHAALFRIARRRGTTADLHGLAQSVRRDLLETGGNS